MSTYSKDLETARKAAQKAAAIINQKFGESSGARVKGAAQGLVTDTDLEAEKAIFEVLRNESSYNILSEESGLLNDKPGPKWVVDPLDGTNNFARSLPMFVVSIGLMENNEFLVGVIVEPVSGNEYYATKGGGAFCNNERLTLPQFQKEFTPALFLNHGYPNEHRMHFKNLVEKLSSDYDTLKLGTTALELCYVAGGSVDGFICSGDSVWDFAGGAVIATEAGCIFSDWQGHPWDGKGNQLIVARPEVHQQLVDKINS